MLLAPDICFGGHTGLATQADRDTTASPSYEPVVVVHVPPPTSSRLASTALAKVPAAKRGEVILMRRFAILVDNAPVCDSARRAYSNVYQSGLTRSHAEAIKEICPSRRTTSTRGSASIPA